MRSVDYLKAAGVALAVMTTTLLFAFPLVAFYARFIEPGQPQEFYMAAAQRIAPWSSHVLGPLLFLGFCYWLTRRSPERNGKQFALVAVVIYAIVDAGSLPLFGVGIEAFLAVPVLVSLMFKTAGALAGAWLGARPAD